MHFIRAAASLLAVSFVLPAPASATATASAYAQADASAPGQKTAQKAVRKTGTIFKYDVDDLVRAVRNAAVDGVLGTDVEHTAKVLAAMGHCHRRYHRGDGPVVRPSIEYLIRHRQADGSFGDVAATGWAIEALKVMDGAAFPEEIAQAEKWLERNADARPATFADLVDRVIGKVRADVFPQHLGQDWVKLAKKHVEQGDRMDRNAAADTLAALAVMQTANRRLDSLQDPKAGGKNVFTKSQQQAFDWLLTQHEDGVVYIDYQGQKVPEPGLTGFFLLALQTKPEGMRTAAEQKTIDQGVKWLLTQQNEDGTFGRQVPNYTTCVAVAALTRVSDPSLLPVLEKAQKSILAFQNIEATGYRESDRDYGSIGYGNSQRGDLSNLHFSLQALKETGLDENHEAFSKAVIFLQRTQNLKSHNDFSGRVPDPEDEGKMIDAIPGDDGGAVYYPGNSNAGYIVQPDGKAIARSYGSMTYALLKAYILAGLPAGDARVQAAVKWIQQNWDLATNPGADPALGEKVKFQGLFYYYMVLAQALDLAGVKHVEVPVEGGPAQKAVKKVDWRDALKKQLEGMQQPSGAWVNGKNGRWMESLELLCTCYAMVALERCN